MNVFLALVPYLGAAAIVLGAVISTAAAVRVFIPGPGLLSGHTAASFAVRVVSLYAFGTASFASALIGLTGSWGTFAAGELSVLYPVAAAAASLASVLYVLSPFWAARRAAEQVPAPVEI